MAQYLSTGNKAITPTHFRLSRKGRYFSKPIETTFLNAPEKDYSTLEINCPDQPGILACVGKVFADNHINLKDARITTLGERVEDLFFITDKNGEPIVQPELMEKLQTDIKTQLEARLAAYWRLRELVEELTEVNLALLNARPPSKVAVQEKEDG